MIRHHIIALLIGATLTSALAPAAHARTARGSGTRIPSTHTHSSHRTRLTSATLPPRDPHGSPVSTNPAPVKG